MKFFKKVKHIHFVGIGGAGMIGIAKVLLKKGYKISGSDISDSRELRKLEKHGAKVSIGPVSYTHLRAPRDGLLSRMPSSA